MTRAWSMIAAVAAGAALAGCANFDGPMHGAQQAPLGPVQITNQFCSEAFGTATFSSSAKRQPPGRLIASTLPAGCANNQPGNGGSSSQTGQLLLGYDLPDGAAAPGSITATEVANGAAGTPLVFNLDGSGAYAAALAAHYGNPAGHKWVGYISDETTIPGSGATTSYIDVTASPVLALPTPGAPFAGPFDIVTAIGDRSTGMTLSSSRPIDCTEETVTSAGSTTIHQHTTACFDDSQPGGVATRDLGIQGDPTSAAQGSTAAVPFQVVFAGSADPSATFAMTGNTNLPGAAATAPTGSYAPATNSTVTQMVNIPIPADAAVGPYTVTLTATVGGISRTGSATLNVTKAPPPPTQPQPIVQVQAFNAITPGGLTLTLGPNQTKTLPYSLTAAGQLVVSGAPRAASLPSGLTRARACSGGLVAIQIKVDKKTISNRLTTLDANCSYRKTVPFHLRSRLGPKGRFAVRARFLGNSFLHQVTSARVFVSYGG